MKFWPFMITGVLLLILWQKASGFVIFLALALVVAIIYFWMEKQRERAEEQERIMRMSPEELAQYERQKAETQLSLAFGPLNAALVCQHCQTKGSVRSTAAVRTSTAKLNTIGGHQAVTSTKVTQRHCGNCQTTWDV